MNPLIIALGDEYSDVREAAAKALENLEAAGGGDRPEPEGLRKGPGGACGR